MFGNKAIQVILIAAIMMICYDARYLLVHIDGENGGMVAANETGIVDSVFLLEICNKDRSCISFCIEL